MSKFLLLALQLIKNYLCRSSLELEYDEISGNKAGRDETRLVGPLGSKP